jgi:hypothetical protein
MLETATWRTMNRRHFAVIEAIYEQIDRSLRTKGWDPSDDTEYAAGLVHQVGSLLLALSIDAGVIKDEKSSSRRAGKAWKSISPESGARASVFLTLAVPAILSPEIEGEKFDHQAIVGARKLIEQVFSVSDDDLKQIEHVKTIIVETLNSKLTKEAVERGGLADVMAIQVGQTAFSYLAMKLAGINVDELPALRPISGVPLEYWSEVEGFDWDMTSSFHFDARWKEPKKSYLDMAYARPTAANIVANRLVSAAFENMLAGSWEWDEIPAIAIVKTADKLSRFREEHNLVLDAIGLGYWIRMAEVELNERVNTFDEDYVADLRERFTKAPEPDRILRGTMNQVRESLPAPFARGAEVWSEVLDTAIHNLHERAEYILADTDEFDENAEISDDLREFALGLGYGLAVAVDALGIDGTRPRQE